MLKVRNIGPTLIGIMMAGLLFSSLAVNAQEQVSGDISRITIHTPKWDEYIKLADVSKE